MKEGSVRRIAPGRRKPVWQPEGGEGHRLQSLPGALLSSTGSRKNSGAGISSEETQETLEKDTREETGPREKDEWIIAVNQW